MCLLAQRLREIVESERGMVGGVGAPYRAAASGGSTRSAGLREGSGLLESFNASTKLGQRRSLAKNESCFF